MNAREKTEYLGFRSYSERENKEREKMFTRKMSELTVFFLQSLLNQEELMIARDLTDIQKEKYYSKAINETYDYALKNDYSLYDLEAVARTLQDLGTMAERMSNFASGEFFKLTYALTGENKFEMVSLKKIADITASAKAVFKHEEAPEEDGTVLEQPVEDTPAPTV